MRAVWEYGQRILDQQWLHTNVTVLGLDETAFLAATAASSTQFVTGMVDLKPADGGPARLLDVVEGRSGQVVTDGLAERGPDWCGRSPPRRWTRSAATSGRAYGAAGRHRRPGRLPRRSARPADDRRRPPPGAPDTLGRRGRTGDPLHSISLVLQRGAERLSATAYRRLLAGLDAGDPRGDLAAAVPGVVAHDLPGAVLDHL